MNISKSITTLLTAALLAICLVAQARAGQTPSDKSSASTSTETAKSQAPAAGVVCPLSVGTAFNARLLQTLDAHKNKAGDKFRAEVTETVRYGRSVIFPRGTIIEGHVVRQSVSTHGADRAALFLQFDKAILKNGQEAVMNAGIQALAVGPTPAAPVETASAADDNDSDAPPRADSAPANVSKLDANLNSDGSAKNVVAVSHAPEDGHAAMIHPPAVDLPLTQGAFTKSWIAHLGQQRRTRRSGHSPLHPAVLRLRRHGNDVHQEECAPRTWHAPPGGRPTPARIRQPRELT